MACPSKLKEFPKELKDIYDLESGNQTDTESEVCPPSRKRSVSEPMPSPNTIPELEIPPVSQHIAGFHSGSRSLSDLNL